MRKAKYLRPISDEEEARIQAGIANDPDNPEVTDEEFAAMRPASEVLPPELYAALTSRRPRAAEDMEETEEVTIALDRTVLDHFRADGPEWQSRISEALKQAIRLEPVPAAHPEDR